MLLTPTPREEQQSNNCFTRSDSPLFSLVPPGLRFRYVRSMEKKVYLFTPTVLLSPLTQRSLALSQSVKLYANVSTRIYFRCSTVWNKQKKKNKTKKYLTCTTV